MESSQPSTFEKEYDQERGTISKRLESICSVELYRDDVRYKSFVIAARFLIY